MKEEEGQNGMPGVWREMGIGNIVIQERIVGLTQHLPHT